MAADPAAATITGPSSAYVSSGATMAAATLSSPARSESAATLRSGPGTR